MLIAFITHIMKGGRPCLDSMDKARKGRDPAPDVARDAATVRHRPMHRQQDAAVAAGWAAAPVPDREWGPGRRCAEDAVERSRDGSITLNKKMENEISNAITPPPSGGRLRGGRPALLPGSPPP